MTHTRNINTQEVASDSPAILGLSQAARQGQVLGIGVCGQNPSGCFDIAKRISLELHNVPFVRIEYITNLNLDPDTDIDTFTFSSLDNDNAPTREYKFLDAPPQTTSNYDTVFFTGCGLTFNSMSTILNSLSQRYQTNIRDVYYILPPHHGNNTFEKNAEENFSLFAKTSYRYRLMSSGVSNSPLNIGIPRFESKSSEFNVPLECYGVIRHSNVYGFLPFFNNKCFSAVETYLNEFFSQVAYAGKDSENKPIMVFAIGIKPDFRQRLVEIAQEYSVVIDFCDQYPAYRLPHQEDFFKVLSAMRDKKGIVSFDDTSTQCLLQALAFEAPVMMYSIGKWPDFYHQLLDLLPMEHQPTAAVILGLSKNYELLKDREECQKIYRLLHLHLENAQEKFNSFKNAYRHANRAELTLIPSDAKFEEGPVRQPVTNDLELKEAFTPTSTESSFFPTLPQKSKTGSAARVNRGNSPNEDKEAVKIFFQGFGKKNKSTSYWYGKEEKEITLTQIVEHANENNQKLIFQTGTRDSTFSTADYLIKNFGVSRQELRDRKIGVIREKILRSKEAVNSLRNTLVGV